MATKKSYGGNQPMPGIAGGKKSYATLKKSGISQIEIFRQKAWENTKVDLYAVWQNHLLKLHKAFVIQPKYEFHSISANFTGLAQHEQIEQLEKQLQQNPYNYKVLEQLAIAYQIKGSNSKALAYYRKANALKKYNALNKSQKLRRHNPINDNFEINLDQFIATNYTQGTGIFRKMHGFFAKTAATLALFFIVGLAGAASTTGFQPVKNPELNYTQGTASFQPATSSDHHYVQNKNRHPDSYRGGGDRWTAGFQPVNNAKFKNNNLKNSVQVGVTNLKPLLPANKSTEQKPDKPGTFKAIENNAESKNLNNSVSISGTVTHNNNTISGIQIKATPLSDTSLQQQTTTNNKGTYSFNFNFVGVNQTQYTSNHLWVSHNGFKTTIHLNTHTPTKSASIYNLFGQKIAVVELEPTGSNNYTGSIHLKANQIIIINAAGLATKYVTGTNTTEPTYSSQYSFKNATTGTKTFRFQLSHPDTLYQPLDTLIEIKTDTDTSINFLLKDWPTFKASVTSVVLMPEPIPDAIITFTNLNDTTRVHTMDVVHSTGGVYGLTIPIPCVANNKMAPDTIPYKVQTSISNMACMADTLRLTDGEFTYEPQCVLHPEFVFASADITVTDSLTNLPVQGAQVNLKSTYNTLNDITFTTGADGIASFDSIRLKVESPMFILGHDITVTITADEHYTATDTVFVDYNHYTFLYQVLPLQQDFYAHVTCTGTNSINNESIKDATVKLWHKRMADTLIKVCDADGKAVFDSIALPTLNEITPDTLLFFAEWTGDNIQIQLDSILMTQGTYTLNSVITPKQQDFYAHVTCTGTNSINNESIKDATVKLWHKRMADTLIKVSDANGEAVFDSIALPTLNEITPDTLLFFAEWTGDSIQTQLDSILMTQGTYTLNSVITPKQQDFYANLSINLTNNTDTQSSDGFLVTLYNADSTWTTGILPVNNTWTAGILPVNNPEYYYNQDINRLEGGGRQLVVSAAQSTANGRYIEGSYVFDSIPIAPVNEITPDTLKYYISAQKNGFTPVLDSVNLTHGTFTKNITVIPTHKNYTLSISTTDQNNEALNQVNWQLLSADSVVIASGNTGTNNLDTANFYSTYPTLPVILKTTKTEYDTSRVMIALTAGQHTVHMVNAIKTYTYVVSAKAIRLTTQLALDSIQLTMLDTLNNTLWEGNSLEDTIVNFEFTAPGHEKDRRFIFSRNGMVNDTVYQTITEGVDNLVVGNMDEEQAYAYLWRAGVPPMAITNATSDIIIKNEEIGYTDTIFSVLVGNTWRDTVPVNATGTTDYEIEYKINNLEGEIPLYDLEKIITLQPNQEAIGMDTIQALEQERKIKMDLIASDTDEKINSLVYVVLKDEVGTVVDSAGVTNGHYESPTVSSDFEGFLNVRSSDTNYFSHKNIPIVLTQNNTYESKMGAIIKDNEVTQWEDSVINYNINMQSKWWISPVNGDSIEINPAILYHMEGNSINLSWAKWGERRMYISGINTEWPHEMASFIERNFGIPYNIIELDEPTDVSDYIIATSLDSTYLESIRNDLQMNVTTISGSGVTNLSGTSTLIGIGFHTKSGIDVRSPPQGENPVSADIVSSTRELIMRDGRLEGLPDAYGISITNGATPQFLDTTNMTLDFAHCSTVYNNYSNRTNLKTGTGLQTIRPSKVEEYFDNRDQSTYYDDSYWKGWTFPPTE